MRHFLSRSVRFLIVPLLIGIAIFVGILTGLMLISGLMTEWELSQRRHVSEQLKSIGAAIETSPGESSGYIQLAKATQSRRRWDRIAAYVRIRDCARVIVKNKNSHRLFSETILPVLKKGLADSDQVVRRESALAAGEYGSLVAPLKTDLFATAMQYPCQDCGWFAVRAIGNMESEGVEMLEPLQSLRVHGDCIEGEAVDAIRKLEAVRTAE